MEIDEGEEIDGAERTVECGWAADGGTDAEIGAEKFGNWRGFRGEGIERAFKSPGGLRSQCRFNQVSAAQFRVDRGPNGGIGRVDGTASAEITGTVIPGVFRDAAPEQAKHDKIAVTGGDAGPSQFDHPRAKRFIGAEIELLSAVVAEAASRSFARLKPVRADHGVGRQVFHDEMIADVVERIGIETGGVRRGQAFAQLDVENGVAEGLCLAKVMIVAGEPEAVWQL